MLLRLTAVKVSVNRWLKSRQGKEGGREGGGGRECGLSCVTLLDC